MNLSRRKFMMAGAFAAGSAWIGVPKALADNKAASIQRFGGFRMGIQSNILRDVSPDLDSTIKHIADVNLHWAEFLGRHYAVTLDDARIAEVTDRLKQHDMAMEAYFLGDIDTNEEETRTIFEFAKRMGVSLLVGQPSPRSFPILDAMVKEYDIKIGIHNYGPGRQYDRTEDAITAAAPWDWRIGYCLDTGHCMRSGEDPVEAVRRMGLRLYGMHLREHESLERGQPRETPVGRGAMDLKGLCRAMRDVHFDGPVSLEIYYARANPLPAIRESVDNFAAAARATA